jgi:hypothetical protein
MLTFKDFPNEKPKVPNVGQLSVNCPSITPFRRQKEILLSSIEMRHLMNGLGREEAPKLSALHSKAHYQLSNPDARSVAPATFEGHQQHCTVFSVSWSRRAV